MFCDSTTASERPIDNVPSVTTNGGNPTQAISTPFTAPAANPVASPAPIASHHGPASCSTSPAAIAANPITEPTDRSMPPVTMTVVMPSAMMPMKAKLRVML